MPPKQQDSISSENHELLVRLSDSVTHLGEQVTTFHKAQQTENRVLHERIDSVQIETRKGVDEIKNTLAQSGKISAGNIFSLIAVLVSVLALIGGITQSYISVRLGNITPLIDHNAAMLHEQHVELRSQREDLTKARIEAARVDESRRWLEKIIESAMTR